MIQIVRMMFFLIIVLTNSFSLADNYSDSLDDDSTEEVYDPYEKINRKFFVFNSFLDHVILRPITVLYKNVTNNYVKFRVRSFVGNINEPLTTINYGLQLKPKETIQSFWRFTINTTLGVGGLYDVASKMGIEASPQTFGSTLARHGVGPGPYLVIPFFGSSNGRDFTDGIITNTYLNPLKYAFHKNFNLALTVTKLIDDRLVLLPFTDHVTQTSIDPYIAVRTAVYQSREDKIKYPKGFICPTTPLPNNNQLNNEGKNK